MRLRRTLTSPYSTPDPTLDIWVRGRPHPPYRPAYRTGYEGYIRYYGRSYEDAEADLQRDYEQNKGTSTVPWEKAKHATRDAWYRVDRPAPGDAGEEHTHR